MKPMETQTQTIALHAAGTKLLAIQPEGEAWQALAVPANGEVSATIPDGPFTLVSVCDEPGLFNYYVTFGGTGDAELDVYCTDPASTVKVSLAAGSKGRAAIGSYPLFGEITWYVKPGIYDVTAYDDSLTPPRFEIRRGVPIMVDTELAFDLATSGTPLEEIAVTAAALAAETVSKRVRLHTAGGTRMTIPATETGTRVWRVPASALQTGDRQTVTAIATTASTSRTSTRAIPNTAVSAVLTLPAALASASATFGPPQRVTWESQGDWTQAYFSAADEDVTVLYDAFVTPNHVEQAGPLTSIELPAPASVPGWSSAWKIPSAAGLAWSLSLTRDLGNFDTEQVGRSGTF